MLPFKGLRNSLATLALELMSGATSACMGSMKADLCIEVYQNDFVPNAAMKLFGVH